MNRQERIVRFQSNVCDECRLCSDFRNENFEPEFCFEKFEENGAVFIEDVHPRLLLVGANLGRQGLQEKDLLYAFCDTGVCYMGDTTIAKECHLINKCTGRFQEQANKMSKRKHKHSKKIKVYSENQFKGIICEQCGICPDKAGPEFCFREVYKHSPQKFMTHLFPRLLKLRDHYSHLGEHISTMDKEEFQYSICRARVCFDEIADCDECCASSDCYDTFMDQTCGIIVFGGKVKKKKTETKTQKKKKASYIPVPYATFFSSSKKGFQEEIQRILYGNNTTEQNKSEEMPGEFVAEINSGSSDGEPEVSGSVETGTQHLGD